METYKGLSDESLLGLIRQGDDRAQDYIIDKYKSLVKAKARAYFLIGADGEDLIQEGMIGLFKAIRDFKADKQTYFYPFAELCVSRQLMTAIKTATRQKHLPLNSYVSLNHTIGAEESETAYLDALKDTRSASPEELFIGRETKKSIEEHLEKALSGMETRVLNLYLQGKGYTEIADLLRKDEKSIDNALQRVRRKLEKKLREKK